LVSCSYIFIYMCEWSVISGREKNKKELMFFIFGYIVYMVNDG
jgi:hypothetical protein